MRSFGSVRFALGLILVLPTLVAAFGCGDDDEPKTSATKPATTGVTDAAEPEGAVGRAERGGGEAEADSPDGEEETGGTPAKDGERSGQPTVEETIKAVLTSGDPALACDRYVTENYVLAAYGGTEGCVAAQVPGSTARSVHVVKLEMSGDGADATVRAQGGVFAGAPLEVDLVRAGARWKLDSLKSDIPPGP